MVTLPPVMLRMRNLFVSVASALMPISPGAVPSMVTPSGPTAFSSEEPMCSQSIGGGPPPPPPGGPGTPACTSDSRMAARSKLMTSGPASSSDF